MDEVKKVSANRQKKIDIVTGLNEKLAKAKAIIFTNYQGITHKQLEALKKAIKPLDAEYVIAKNSLIKRAMENGKLKIENDEILKGPTGTLLIYADAVAPLKQLGKTIKELGVPSVKLGIMENKFLTGEQVLKISSLPAREVLFTQLVSGLKSPIFGLHRSLSWNLRKLVLTLNAVSKAKPAVATAPVTETPQVQAEETKPEEPVAKAIVEVLASEPVAETTVEASQTEPKPTQTENKDDTQIGKGGEN